MSEAVLVAVISGVCTLIGSCVGVIASQSLTQYRLKKLEGFDADGIEVHEKICKTTGETDGNSR